MSGVGGQTALPDPPGQCLGQGASAWGSGADSPTWPPLTVLGWFPLTFTRRGTLKGQAACPSPGTGSSWCSLRVTPASPALPTAQRCSMGTGSPPPHGAPHQDAAQRPCPRPCWTGPQAWAGPAVPAQLAAPPLQTGVSPKGPACGQSPHMHVLWWAIKGQGELNWPQGPSSEPQA